MARDGKFAKVSDIPLALDDAHRATSEPIGRQFFCLHPQFPGVELQSWEEQQAYGRARRARRSGRQTRTLLLVYKTMTFFKRSKISLREFRGWKRRPSLPLPVRMIDLSEQKWKKNKKRAEPADATHERGDNNAVIATAGSRKRPSLARRQRFPGSASADIQQSSASTIEAGDTVQLDQHHRIGSEYWMGHDYEREEKPLLTREPM
ncbi:hypothetical protein KC321_g62 [Hortaea werneckii]|nr:hypothetical protein KC321_g62 [Hortaea werneckii]